MKIKRIAIGLLVPFVLLIMRESAAEKKDEATHSKDYEDPNRIDFIFKGEFRRSFSFSCIATKDFSRSSLCSPLGAFLPLGKLLIAATPKSPAEKQLLRAIGDSTKKYKVLHQYGELVTAMSTMLGGVHLDIASQWFLAHTVGSISKAFHTMTSDTFHTTRSIEYINNRDPVTESDKINAWVYANTHGKITNLVDPTDISEHTQILLVNAVYFSGAWATSFSTIYRDKFYAPEISVNLLLMQLEDYFQYGYSKTLEASALVIPYQGEKVFFYIFLSTKKDGYKELSSKLKNSPVLLTHFVLSTKRVNLTMPQFKYDFTVNMKPLYEKCNLRAIFDPKVGLGEVIPGQILHVSKAIHKVQFEVIGGGETKPPKFKKTRNETIQFLANRPFVYAVAAGRHVLLTVFFLLAITLAIDSKYTNKNKRGRGRNHQSAYGLGEVVTNQFDLRGDLRRRIAIDAALSNPNRSLICSPFSALLPLGKLALGASGTTEKELVRAIGTSDVAQHFKSLLSKLRDIKGIHLDIASQVYVSNQYPLMNSYQNKIKDVFSSGVESVNMEDSHGVAGKINSWVARQTHGKIDNLVSASDINSYISTILVNAVYFSGKWAKPFEMLESHQEFFGPSGRVRVPMMTITDYFSYGESSKLNARVINIPYQKGEVFFTIILPKETHGLNDVLHRLRDNPDLINSVSMYDTKVKITMPKFKIETEFDLGALYSLIGLREIFNTGMSGMVKDKSIVVGKAIQKAMIEVTEEGTTAAAASAVLLAGYPMYVPPTPNFTADHPFLFYIMMDNQQIFSGTFKGK